MVNDKDFFEETENIQIHMLNLKENVERKETLLKERKDLNKRIKEGY